jgi:hypothetical protein
MGNLWPREHGAYAQLGFPLLSGLIYAGGEPGAVAFAAVAVCHFFAHEPLAVLTGMRGARLKKELEESAWVRLVMLAVLSGVALLGAFLFSPARAWLGAALPAALGLMLVPLFLSRRIKTVAGELLVAAASAAALLPVALAGGTPDAVAIIAASVWFAASAPAVVAVHAIKAASKPGAGNGWLIPAAPVLAALVLVAAISTAFLFPPPARLVLAALPVPIVVLALTVLRPHPRHLKRIGWALVAANSLTLVFLLAL